jgi:hypothetical protein
MPVRQQPMLTASSRGAALLLLLSVMSSILPGVLPIAPAHADVMICSDRVAVGDVDRGVQVPVCSDRPLDVTDASVSRLIVVLHGDARNAVGYLDHVVAAAELSGVDDALVVAPQFLTNDDGVGDVHTWTSGGWKRGDLSTRDRSPRVSSFEVVDDIVVRTVASGRFPSLREIVIAGHSAGGQFVNRYAATNRVMPGLESRGFGVRFVVANPSSYLYLSPERAVRRGFGLPHWKQIAACGDYDDYKYGLSAPNAYVSSRSADAVQAQYRAASVSYLLGEEDTATTGAFDSSCAAALQGEHRLDRGRVYHAYLAHHYGKAVHDRHLLSTVPQVGHSARGMFTSVEGQASLFGEVAPASSTEPVRANGSAKNKVR